ncbi:Hypothetical predicted protein [Cloeon dipterum]|uniref:Uncharacterized protein n=1 Tax=Cloeon dipterum TaxID=197152 RepID=A0A8S1DZI3_9INSE|nr:Hypothetical predicted protein [Cloeon dipterum]
MMLFWQLRIPKETKWIIKAQFALKLPWMNPSTRNTLLRKIYNQNFRRTIRSGVIKYVRDGKAGRRIHRRRLATFADFRMHLSCGFRNKCQNIKKQDIITKNHIGLAPNFLPETRFSRPTEPPRPTPPQPEGCKRPVFKKILQCMEGRKNQEYDGIGFSSFLIPREKYDTMNMRSGPNPQAGGRPSPDTEKPLIKYGPRQPPQTRVA